MHLDDERILRLLHVELSRTIEDEARAHLARCDECRLRVEAARRDEYELHDLLGRLDQPARPLEVEAVLAQAIVVRSRASEPPREIAWLQHAASFVVALALAAAAYGVYAMPGSPVRAWVTSLAAHLRQERSQPRAAAPQLATPPSAADSSAAGIAVTPGPSLVIQFTTLRVDEFVEIALTDRTEVEVRAPIGAATYTSDADRLAIDNRGNPATFHIDIPRDAPRVEIRAGDARLFLKDGSRVVTTGPESGPPYRLPLR